MRGGLGDGKEVSPLIPVWREGRMWGETEGAGLYGEDQRMGHSGGPAARLAAGAAAGAAVLAGAVAAAGRGVGRGCFFHVFFL